MDHDRVRQDREEECALVERAKRGDRSALRELIDRHKDRLFGFIWRMVRDHHEADDVCQDAFLKAFSSLDSFSTEYRFSTWLFTIGYRICLNRMRRRRPLSMDGLPSARQWEDARTPAMAAESAEVGLLRERIWEAVDLLSPPQRATVLLFYRQEMSCHEIARIVQLPLATVKSHLHRARAKLRELLEAAAIEKMPAFRNLLERTG